MNATAIVVAGTILIGLIGASGRSREKGMSSWLVAEPGLPRWTSWFLRAGDSKAPSAWKWENRKLAWNHPEWHLLRGTACP